MERRRFLLLAMVNFAGSFEMVDKYEIGRWIFYVVFALLVLAECSQI